jgi:RHS repeat-associated protein
VITRIRGLFIVMLTLSLLRMLNAQQTPDIAPGIQPSQSYSGGQFDAINLQNGNLTARLPLISYPQRGGKLKLSFSLVWNGKPWVPSQFCTPAPASKCTGFWLQNGGIVPAGLEVPTGMSVVDDQDVQWQYYNYQIKEANNPNDVAETYSIAEWHTSDGAIHTGGEVTGTQIGQVSLDGSGFYNGYQQNWGTGASPPCTAHCYTTDSQGISYYVNGYGGAIIREDANGNQITAQYNSAGDIVSYLDTVGRTIPAPPTSASASTSGDSTGCSGTLPIYSVALWQVPGENGSTLTFKFCYAQVSISLPQTIAKGSTVFAEQTTTVNLQSVVLPSGQTWTFAYNSRSPGDSSSLNYGDLTQITFPTGGSLSYTYQFKKSNINEYSMTVLSRVRNANDNLGAQTWSYSGIFSSPVAVTDPLLNETDHIFTELGVGGKIAYEISRQEYQGAASGGNLLKTTQTGYSFEQVSDPNDAAYGTGVYSVFPTSITTTLNNGLSSVETKTLCCSFTFSADVVGSLTSTYGLVASDSVYDYTASGTGPLLRQTQTTYEFQQNSTYLAANMLRLPASTAIMNGQGVTVSSTSFTYDEPNYLTPSGLGSSQQLVTPVSPVRGDLSTTTSWLNGGTSPQTHTNWYDTGEPHIDLDAKSNPTTMTYQCSGTFPYQKTNALNQTTTYGYDCNRGLLTSVQDPNDLAAGRPGTQYVYNSSDDVTQISYPDGGSVTGNYNSYAVPLNISTTTLASPDPSIMSSVVYDGLGRPATSTAPNGAMTVTTYDGVGNTSSVSNPHFSSSSATDGTTYYTYDALGRKKIQTQPDGSTLNWSYNGNIVTSTDEVRNTWTRTSDALGRLTNVVEPIGSSTSYIYDAVGNLLTVNQPGIAPESPRPSRSFSYDSLSRLQTSSNPETGTMSYTYLLSGTMCGGDISLPCSKTDARGITTTYSYDALNRLTLKQYSDGTVRAAFGYDGRSDGGVPLTQPSFNSIGRLSEISNDVNVAATFSYDPVGRVVQQNYCLPSDCSYGSVTKATYDLAGNVTSLMYPDGRVVKQNLDSAGHLQTVTFDNWNGQNVNYQYLNSASYWPNGSLYTMTFGNGATQTYTLNNRLQPQEISLKGGAIVSNQMLFDKQYCYGPSTADCTTLGNGTNNGNIWQITDPMNSTRTQGFSYDSLNRLSAFSNGDGSMQQSYVTDSFGNMVQSGTLSSGLSFGSNNRINSLNYGYDAAGNLTQSYNGLSTTPYSYDAESRLVSVNSAAYTYDASGNRVRKDISPNWTEYVNFNGQTLAEKNSDGTWSDYIYANGRRIARADSYDVRIYFTGTNCTGCGYQAWAYNIPIAQNVIQAGDKIAWRQCQEGPAVPRGGIGILFTDGTYSNGQAFDQEGVAMNDEPAQGIWKYRIADLSQFAGKTIQTAWIDEDANSGPGDWQEWFSDIAFIRADGTVQTIFNRQPGFSPTGAFGPPGVTNQTFEVNVANLPAFSENAMTTTNYYVGDQIGSTRMELAAAGWPVSSDTLYPFGQEQSATSSPNHYKFTGKERDAESGLDYFGARYYGSSMGRYMSPDWSAKQEPVPYSKLDNPQTLNLYSYVQYNPLSNFDDDGHATIEVKYNPLALGSNHSFIVVTDRDGTQTVFRAGPSVSAGTGWITPATGGSASQSATPTSSQSDSSNSSSPGAGTTAQGNPYGQLVSQQESPTDPNGDNMSTISGSTTVLSNDLPASSYINGLQQFDTGLNQANIPYNPLSTNSNAYVTNALQSIGVPTPKAPVWAPGAGTNLHVTPAPPAPPPPGPPPCSVAGACSTK